ncbi:phosphoglycerate kinase [Flavobacteriaceae bacterium]|nr:phosphoglycerate kinase [Flavobacteriaceae bacterium]|tara:strand:- start:50 stop:1237 length:1188 start_codon:yes stop_codon:yes gene_type:complete
MKSIDQYSFKGKKVIIRVDFNVPLNSQKQVTDNSRIDAAKSTILKIINDGGSCILMSHLGRPKGEDQNFSLKHLVDEIEKTLGLNVKFVSQSVGEIASKAANEIKPKEVLLLENLRFHLEESIGDENFAKKLASLADCYVNDAFGTAHRAHASTAVIAKHFPNKKFAGHLLLKEVSSIQKVMDSGEKPVLGILGGAKVSSKITIIDNIIDKVDSLIIGGGMAFTFVKALGGSIGNSICENDKTDLALSILEKAKEKNVSIHLPLDVVCGDDFSEKANIIESEINNIPEGWEGMDAGPKSRKLFDKIINESKTILWNGPVGVFELSKFSKGTIAIGESISRSTKNGAFSLVGGGDSVAAVKKFNFENKVSYVSTGGGAMLESLEGKILPGIQALMD